MYENVSNPFSKAIFAALNWQNENKKINSELETLQ
jgi:hypothetical protein